VGDRLAAALDVPIGFLNVACGGTSTDDYVARLQAIRAAAVEAWEFGPMWLCAFSTHHPTVYQYPEGEDRIRAAISRLGQLPRFWPGT
jgi:hypothetical protein